MKPKKPAVPQARSDRFTWGPGELKTIKRGKKRKRGPAAADRRRKP